MIKKRSKKRLVVKKKLRKRRKAVVWIVFKWLEKYQKIGAIHELPFDEILTDVRKFMPATKFSPAHLAWYKHHFLKGDLEYLYDGHNSTGIEK